MNVGVSTACFYPMETEKTPPYIKECGAGICEVFLETLSEYEPDYIKALNESLGEASIVPISCHGIAGLYEPMIFTDYTRRTDDCMKIFEKHAAACHNLGAKYITFHGARSAATTRDFDFKKFAQKIDVLNDIAASNGVTFTWENVSWCQSNDPEFIKKALEYIRSEQHFTLDIKQAIRAGRSPFEYIEVMGKNLVNFHINDHSDTEPCLLPGAGNCDFVSIIKKMKEYGYNGDCIIEVYGTNYSDYSEIADSVRFLEKIVSVI